MSITIDGQEYQMISRIGKGTFSEVFKLKFKSLYDGEEHNIALKRIALNNLSNEEIERCKDEVKIMRKLHSIYLIGILGYSIDQNYFNILMHFGGDSNLKNFITKYKDKSQLIEENIIGKIIRQICLGLRKIHENNLIHRDLTPENIFIDENNNIKIGDFGISKILEPNSKYAKHHYNAPEIEKGQPYDNKADIYSFGCIIYELFTLNEYFLDKFYKNKASINTDIYNPAWQKLIDSLCKIDYHQRPTIEEIYQKLKNIIVVKKKKKKIKVIFKSRMGSQYEIYCDVCWTIQEIKDEFAFISGYDEHFDLVFEGIELNPKETLEDYNVENEDVICFIYGPRYG